MGVCMLGKRVVVVVLCVCYTTIGVYAVTFHDSAIKSYRSYVNTIVVNKLRSTSLCNTRSTHNHNHPNVFYNHSPLSILPLCQYSPFVNTPHCQPSHYPQACLDTSTTQVTELTAQLEAAAGAGADAKEMRHKAQLLEEELADATTKLEVQQKVCRRGVCVCA